jgi:hypothetical protein
LILPDFKAGQVLEAEELQQLSAAADSANNLRVDAASGLQAIALPSGTAIRRRREMVAWVKVTGGGPLASYFGTEQLEQAGGAWANGPRTWAAGGQTLLEINGNTAVPTSGSTIVRAFRDRRNWYFAYGAC